MNYQCDSSIVLLGILSENELPRFGSTNWRKTWTSDALVVHIIVLVIVIAGFCAMRLCVVVLAGDIFHMEL